MVPITDVLPRSRAEKAGLRAGDLLVSINGHEIGDVLDYRFYLAETSIDLSFIRDGKTKTIRIKKQEYDDIGLDFETPLMDKKHSCENKCIFCFIDQLPKGLRSSLYFKDDDSRLSFLHGNYVTMTNLREKDIHRIMEMHISPINVSVHTTNPELRIKMMHNKRAGEVLSYLPMLANAGISLCCQIVLCRGVNDGEELARTMRDLEALYPAMESTAIVPAGLTRFREGLYELSTFSPEECRAIIAQINEVGDRCKETYGTRLFYPSDEFYLKAGLPLPDDEYYEAYSQIENGVGMLTDLETDFDIEMAEAEVLRESFRSPRHVSIVTGYAAYEHLSRLAKKLCEVFDGLTVDVHPIRNDFFGHEITVAGLLTGTDMKNQLAGKTLGDALLIPAACLRAEGDVFLDDLSPANLSEALGGIPILPVENTGRSLIYAALNIQE